MKTLRRATNLADALDDAMTEAEWLACSDPNPMLEFLQGTGKASDRKLRLFAVACCRQAWHRIPKAVSRQAVDLAEAAADEPGLLKNFPYTPAYDRRWAAHKLGLGRGKRGDVADHAAYGTTYFFGVAAASVAVECGLGDCYLLREIFGPLPFRPLPADPSWLAWNDRTVVKLAQTIYDDRAYDWLPILANALEDAGCSEVDILAHCRGSGPHVRACWVVDLVLGKE
jgi:hypothetical protein